MGHNLLLVGVGRPASSPKRSAVTGMPVEHDGPPGASPRTGFCQCLRPGVAVGMTPHDLA